MTDPVDEVDGKVTVTVGGEDVIVPRPPFRRFRKLLPLIAGLTTADGAEVDDNGNLSGSLPLDVIIDCGEEIGRVLFGDEADAHLDRIYTPQQWGDFVSSAVNALQLGEAGASTSS